MTVERAWRFIDSIRQGLAVEEKHCEGVRLMLARLAGQDLTRPRARSHDRRRLQACRFLAGLIDETAALDPVLTDAVTDFEDRLSWRQNPNYSDAAMGQPGYMDATPTRG